MQKESGQVFTPIATVNLMLDLVGYKSERAILKKHLIDNSCGEGAFLVEAVSRYCRFEKDKVTLKKDLETFIHGIELDEKAYQKCQKNLNESIKNCGLKNVEWDIRNGDALICNNYDGKMDYVVGNPPYIRVHNLNKAVSIPDTYKFIEEGMTDSYLAFFELSIRMTNLTGKIAYITPNSWLTSAAGNNMRRELFDKRMIRILVDFHHYNPFEGITTYPIVSVLSRQSNECIECFDYEGKVLYNERKLLYEAMQISEKFYLEKEETLSFLKRILESGDVKKVFQVKNGFATLADSIFIQKELPFDQFKISVIKASTGEWKECFYPYDWKGCPLPERDLSCDGKLLNYLRGNRKKLIERSIADKSDWFLFGRTQALRDVCQYKVSISSIINSYQTIKLSEVKPNEGVYGGLYILGGDFAEIERMVRSEIFFSYVKALKKYKSGGYYTFNSKDLELFLNYMLNKTEKE